MDIKSVVGGENSIELPGYKRGFMMSAIYVVKNL